MYSSSRLNRTLMKIRHGRFRNRTLSNGDKIEVLEPKKTFYGQMETSGENRGSVAMHCSLVETKNENCAVNIRQRGNQSKHLVEISERIVAGTPISHILYYKLSQEPTNTAYATNIRKMLKSAVWEQQNFEQVETIPGVAVQISVMWRMPTAGTTCAYYYTDAGFTYSDSAIKKHTRMMLRRFTSQIRAQHPEYGVDWGLAYLVTRALDAAVLQEGPAAVQFGGNIGGAEHLKEDEDEDEEEE